MFHPFYEKKGKCLDFHMGKIKFNAIVFSFLVNVF